MGRDAPRAVGGSVNSRRVRGAGVRRLWFAALRTVGGDRLASRRKGLGLPQRRVAEILESGQCDSDALQDARMRSYASARTAWICLRLRTRSTAFSAEPVVAYRSERRPRKQTMHTTGPPRSTGHSFTSSTPYGPVQLQLDAGVARLRGAGATTVKSALFLFVSSKAGEEQLSFRFAARAALSGSAGVPSQAVPDP